jgi:hypothetical protein
VNNYYEKAVASVPIRLTDNCGIFEIDTDKSCLIISR